MSDEVYQFPFDHDPDDVSTYAGILTTSDQPDHTVSLDTSSARHVSASVGGTGCWKYSTRTHLGTAAIRSVFPDFGFTPQHFCYYARLDFTAGGPEASSGFGFRFINAGGNMFSVYWNALGYLVAYRGTDPAGAATPGTIVQTSTLTADINAGHWFQIDYVPADSGGTLVVLVDGVEYLNYTGDTNNTAIAGVTSIRPTLGYRTSGSAQEMDLYLDDLHVTSATVGTIGESYLSRQAPTGDRSVTFAPSSGSLNYALIDEVVPSESDYIETTTDGAEDVYDMAPVASSGASVNFVSVMAVASRDGALTGFELGVKYASTTARADAQSTGASGVVSQIQASFLNNPHTGQPWTDAEVNQSKCTVRADNG